MTTPRLLALDSATDQLALGLLVDGQRHTRLLPGGAQASATVLPALLGLLADAGLPLAAVDAVAFGHGPGAFTGLRTACAVAQGLAFGAAKPVLALDSLLLVADDARQQHGGDTWWVAMDARMDEAYAAAYRHDGARWLPMRPPRLYTLGALGAQWALEPPLRVAGSGVAAFAERLPWGAALRVATEADRGGALLRLAEAAWADGPHLDPADALPLYLRDKVAQTTAERAALRAAQAPA